MWHSACRRCTPRKPLASLLRGWKVTYSHTNIVTKETIRQLGSSGVRRVLPPVLIRNIPTAETEQQESHVVLYPGDGNRHDKCQNRQTRQRAAPRIVWSSLVQPFALIQVISNAGKTSVPSRICNSSGAGTVSYPNYAAGDAILPT